MIRSISENEFRNGHNNIHPGCDNITHSGNDKVDEGVYVTSNLETAKIFAGTIYYGGEICYTIFLVRVKENCIRQCACHDASDYWVVNGSPDEILPEKLLYAKKI